MKNSNRHVEWLKWLSGLLFLSLALAAGLAVQNLDLEWLVQLKLYPANCLLLVILLYGIKALTMVVIPTELIYLATSLLFPPVQAVVIALAGITGEFILNFYMGRILGQLHFHRLILWLSGHSTQFSRMFDQQYFTSPLTIFFLRLLPGPANNISSVFLGATDLELLPYLWPSLLGALPKAAMLTLAGSFVFNPGSWGFWLFTGACGLIAILAFVWQQNHQRAGGKLTADDSSQH